MAGIGAAAGIAAAMVAAPLVQSLLFRTSPRDPVSIAVAAGTLLIVTLAAAAVPAWRATRVSPTPALRGGE